MKALIILLPFLVSCIGSPIKSADTVPGATGGPGSSSPTVWSNTPVSTTFIYRANSSLNSISVGSIDTTTGQIIEHHEVDTGAATTPVGLAIRSTEDVMYVANSQAGTIAWYAIDQATGNITKTSEVSTFPQPTKMVIHPNGLFLYTLHANFGQISVHTINPSTGALAFASSAGMGSAGAQGLAITPNGEVLAATNNSWLQTFTVNTGTGAITYSGNQNPNWYLNPIAHPTQNEIYAPMKTGNMIWNYDLDITNGAFSANSVSYGNTMFPPTVMNLDSTASYAYLATGYPNTLESFVVNPSTSLTFRNSVSLPPGCEASSINFSQDGAFVFASCSNASGRTITFKVNANGSIGSNVHTTEISGAGVKQALIVTF